MGLPLPLVTGILDHVLDGAIVVDPDGRVIYANRDAQRIFARDGADLVGMPLAPLLSELPPGWPTPGSVAVEARRPSGPALPVRAVVTPVDGHWVVTLQDRASVGIVPAMPDPVEDPLVMFRTIATALDAFLFAGEMAEGGWYLPLLHGPGIDRLLGAEVADGDVNRVYDTCVHPEDYPAYEALYDVRARSEGVPMEAVYRLRGLDGVLRWVRERSVVREADGRTLILGVVLDVTAEIDAQTTIERARTERAAAAARLERVVELSSDLIVVADRAGVVQFANPAVERLLGYRPEEVVGGGWEQLCHPDDVPEALGLLADEFAGRPAPARVLRCGARDGTALHVSWAGALDEQEGAVVLLGRDVTADVAARAEVERRSRTDALTGLYNRRHLVDALNAELERARREGRRPGVLILDLDGFKLVNDLYGHVAGDAVLSEVARRLRTAVRRYDVVARWGGEEFCVLAPAVSTERALRRVAEGIRRAVGEAPMPLADGRLLHVTASVGGVLASDGLWSVEGLVDAADRALYTAKRRGRNRICLAGDLTVEDLVAEEPEALRLAEALALSAGSREAVTEDHAREVAELAQLVAQRLGLTEDTALRCRLGGWLHDLGKIAIPDSVLQKPGPLDESEWAVMRTHPEVGERIVKRIAGLSGAAPAIRHHHERFDGGGYPDGLAGDEIPIEARIVAVADAFSTLTESRSYRPARSADEAIEALREGAGTWHDPGCVDALVDVLDGRTTPVRSPAR